MGTSYSPKIPTSGLVMCLDAANPKSYPGTGTTWKDLSGNGNHGTLTGTITHTTVDNTIVLSCPGTTGNYIQASSPDMTTGTSTVMCGTRKNGVDNGRVISGGSNNWLLGHHGLNHGSYYAGGWVNQPSPGTGGDIWRTYAGTADVSGDLYSLYTNGAAVVTNSTGGASGPNGLTMGRYFSDTEYSACYISFVLIYDRVLTAEEIKQIHYTYRGRFGI